MPTPEFPSSMWTAIAAAEMRGKPKSENKFIRTQHAPAAGSTAYGPVQLTGTTAADYAKNKKLSPESQQFYQQKMAPMYEAFRKFGREPKKAGYDPKFDYGGAGTLDPVNDFPGYEGVTTDIMKDMWQRANGDPTKFIQLWRGVAPSADPAYFKTALDMFRSS